MTAPRFRFALSTEAICTNLYAFTRCKLPMDVASLFFFNAKYAIAMSFAIIACTSERFAGNDNAQSSTFTVRADPASRGAPVVTITAEAASATLTSGSHAAAAVTFVATASESTDGGGGTAFGQSHLVVSGAASCTPDPAGATAGKVYKTVCNAEAGPVDFVATVSAGVFVDWAGNANTAATHTVTMDTDLPTVTITATDRKSVV